MPEHVHILLYMPREKYSISEILQSMKQPVARKVLHAARKHGELALRPYITREKATPFRFWQAGGGYCQNVWSDKMLSTHFHYIHANPVRRDLVQHPEDWNWSSAHAWATNEDLPLRIDRQLFPLL